MSVFLCCTLLVHAQKNALVFGIIRDSLGRAIPDVNVAGIGTDQLTISNERGYFQLSLPPNTPLEIGLSYIGRPNKRISVRVLAPGEKYELNVNMEYGVRLTEVVVSEERDRDKVSMQVINPKTVTTLPNVSGSFESILKTLPGVTSNNELSSQYNVRGGNYDENLIYVNDIEIYRPFLPRSGQQEGLSFIHTELVENVKFSAGGFEARYGDKLSSVLDIQYKKPKQFGSSVNLSLLGAQTHVEGSTHNRRFTYLLGARYWTNQYVVSTLDTKGSYQPSFSDVQTLLTYHLKDNLSVSVLGSYAQNKYLVIPETRETIFGTVKQALALRIFFNGQDLMEYRTATGAVSINYQPTQKVQLKLYSSVFYSNENELFTLEGAYRLEEVETDFGSDNFGKSKASKGIGYFLNNARNQIEAVVYNAGHRGYYTIGNNSIQWGAQIQVEQISDKLNEWRYIDSLGFAKPTLVNNEIVMMEYITSQNTLNSYRLSGYVQNSQLLNKRNNMRINYGLRSNWWSYNSENVISPRVQFSFEPNRIYNRVLAAGNSKGVPKKDIILKAAVGFYYQPPFYREFRNFTGQLNPNIKAQRSIHYIVGGDINFKSWGRPFKFFAEAYYKQLDNLIPYEIDNVRIRYFADNVANGYATGIDMRINGEFVKGTESWLSVSVLNTEEKINGVVDASGNAVAPHYVRRPTDQRVNVSLMFQDYLPKFPTFRMYLNLVYGSGLPFGPPDRNRYNDTLPMPSYRRVDIGFLKVVVDENDAKKKGWKRHFKSVMAGVEIFNILDVQNTISYLWIQDVEARTWAVPNYLTGRRINLKIVAKF
ncbi:MAG: TonB-dependent receptor plug domain-containing protein [Bacteroidota bacterium]